MFIGKLEEVLTSSDVQPTRNESNWQDCLIRALVEMPTQLAQEILKTIPKDILLKMLENRDDPYIKLAILLLNWR